MEVNLPNNWEPRAYQLPVLQYLADGGSRAVSVWHRRAGKDSAALNYTAVAMQHRVGSYWHLFPEQAQARKAIWNGIDRMGRRIIDQAFPREIRRRTLDNEMMIEFANGSIWQLVGSDRYDSLVGTNPVGCVFSEYALADPQAWEYIRPILAENGGWAWFISTPRGRNHFWQMFEMALRNDDWHAELLSATDTGMLSEEDIQAERDAGMAESSIRQEFYCSFEESAATQFIPQSSIDAAQERSVSPSGPVVMGVDVARFGDDSSVVLLRDGDKVKWSVRWQGLDTMQTASRVAEFIGKHKPDAVFVDDIGVGAGVTDRLRQLGYRVHGVNAGGVAANDTRYINRRAEMWGRMREWLQDRADIPEDQILASDLAMVQYEYDARNRIKLEKKEDMKKRGLPSPDVGDALALTFAEPVALLDVRDHQNRRGMIKAKPVNPFSSLYG